jgi:hypothetical protein
MNVSRPPQPRRAGYGLPCAKCRRYFSADLDACPICKGRDRVSPVISPAQTPSRTLAPVEPTLIASSLELQRDRFPEESDSPLFEQEEFSVQEVRNSPTLSGLQERQLAETEPAAAARPPETQVSVDLMLSDASLAQEPEDLPTRPECPMSTAKEDIVAQQKTDAALSALKGVGDCQPSDAELDAGPSLPQAPALEPTPTAVALEYEHQELPKEFHSPMVEAPREIAAEEETCISTSMPQLDECGAADWETGGSESAPPLPELTGSNSGRQFEVLTIVLAVVVLVCAVFMTVLVGLRLTGHHSIPPSTHKTATARGTVAPSTASLPTPRLTASTEQQMRLAR